MKTIIYLCRHSEPIDMYDNKNETMQLRNEKISLSVLGEEKARKLSLLPELNNIDNVIASNYVRAIATAKYIAFNNKKNIEVIPEFGERKFGNINSWSDLPKGFSDKQIKDWDYKFEGGESFNEVCERMYFSLQSVLKKYKGKKIFIVSHGTAISVLFSKIADVFFPDEENYNRGIYFNGKLIFDGKYDAPELFKLEYEDEKLVDVKNIKIKY